MTEYLPLSSRMLDLTGHRFGRLTSLGFVRKQGSHSVWRCRCDCGVMVDVLLNNLRSGNTRSCGCLAVHVLKERATSHGMSDTREYGIWCGIKNRCNNVTLVSYSRYGARGVKVCERWEGSFTAFLGDMGPCPTPKHSIERVDNNGDYCPDNCCWVTATEQARNRRTNRFIGFRGGTKTIAGWAEYLNISYQTLCSRFNYGWSVEEAFTIPVDH